MEQSHLQIKTMDTGTQYYNKHIAINQKKKVHFFLLVVWRHHLLFSPG